MRRKKRQAENACAFCAETSFVAFCADCRITLLVCHSRGFSAPYGFREVQRHFSGDVHFAIGQNATDFAEGEAEEERCAALQRADGAAVGPGPQINEPVRIAHGLPFDGLHGLGGGGDAGGQILGHGRQGRGEQTRDQRAHVVF